MVDMFLKKKKILMELNSLIMIDILSEDYGESFRLTINNWKKNKIKRWRDLERKSGACLPRDTLARAIMLVSADIISTTHVWERGAPSGRKEGKKEGWIDSCHVEFDQTNGLAFETPSPTLKTSHMFADTAPTLPRAPRTHPTLI